LSSTRSRNTGRRASNAEKRVYAPERKQEALFMAHGFFAMKKTVGGRGNYLLDT
jgi:hypothetical protein